MTLFSYAVYLIICILCPFIYPNQYPHEGMSAANFPMLYNWFTPKLNRHKMLYNLAHVIVADIRSNVLRRVIMLNNTSTNKPFWITRFTTNLFDKVDSYRFKVSTYTRQIMKWHIYHKILYSWFINGHWWPHWVYSHMSQGIPQLHLLG